MRWFWNILPHAGFACNCRFTLSSATQQAHRRRPFAFERTQKSLLTSWPCYQVGCQKLYSVRRRFSNHYYRIAARRSLYGKWMIAAIRKEIISRQVRNENVSYWAEGEESLNARSNTSKFHSEIPRRFAPQDGILFWKSAGTQHLRRWNLPMSRRAYIATIFIPAHKHRG